MARFHLIGQCSSLTAFGQGCGGRWPGGFRKPVDFPVVAMIEGKVSVHRTCSDGAHASGIARLWYNGQPIHSGGQLDAGSRFDAVSYPGTFGHFLRGGLALRTTPGRLRRSVDDGVDTKETCQNRTLNIESVTRGRPAPTAGAAHNSGHPSTHTGSDMGGAPIRRHGMLLHRPR